MTRMQKILSDFLIHIDFYEELCTFNEIVGIFSIIIRNKLLKNRKIKCENFCFEKNGFDYFNIKILNIFV